MHTFQDTQGRTWTVTINVDAIRRVRAQLDINLLEAIEGKLLERLVTDPVILCDILFVLVQPEAQAKSVRDEDFGRALGGDALEQATTALLEELVDFFPSGKRTLFRKALDKLKRLEGIALQTATERLESNVFERKMAESLESGVRSPEKEKSQAVSRLLLQTPVSGLQTQDRESLESGVRSPEKEKSQAVSRLLLQTPVSGLQTASGDSSGNSLASSA